jgi:outer membrane immunogenic protein
MEVATSLKQSAAAVAAAAAASSGAMAADLTVKAPPPPVPVSTWQGFYLGGSVGASWLHATQDDTAAVGSTTSFASLNPANNFPLNVTTGGAVTTANGAGFLGGLNLGFNFQSGNFVYGVEGSFSWVGSTSASSNGTIVNQAGYPSTYAGTRTNNGTAFSSSKVSELATLRARFGIDFNGTLPYLTTGVAWGHIQNTFTISGAGYTGGAPTTATATQTSWVPGIVLGGGIEHKLTQNLTIRGEIMWVGFADKSLANPLFSTTYSTLTSTGGPVKFSNELTIGQIGLNYRY